MGVVGDDPEREKNNPYARFQENTFVDIILTNERYRTKFCEISDWEVTSWNS